MKEHWEKYKMDHTKKHKNRSGALMPVLLLLLIAAMGVSIVAGIFLGSVDLDAGIVLDVLKLKLFGMENSDLKRSAVSIVWELRFPRALLAIAAGGGLAVAGAAMQAVTQNVLADPYILGASSGASAAVAFTFVMGGPLAQKGSVISAFAFGGAMLSLMLVYSVGMIGSAGSSGRLVLAGMAVSVMLTAATQFFISIAPDAYTVRSITSWTMGSLTSARWNTIGFPICGALIGSLFFMFIARAFNLLSQGDETAAGLGVDVKTIKRLTIVFVSLITGSIVAAGGVIGFIGFIIPHIIRFLIGSDHRKVFPLAFLGGGLFLMWMDVLSRNLIAPKELPVGILTAFCGGPFFIWLLYRKNRR